MRHVEDQLRLEKLRWRERFLSARVLAADRSSEVLHLIAEATDGDSARVALRDALGLDLDQVEVVLTVQFAHLHAAARRVRSHELQELRASIDALAAVLATPDSPTS
jgi:DNA gyrase/topoisomerase IV subunit A